MLKAWMCSCLALGLLLLVPLPARAALETVTVREHHDSVHGDGLELSFKPLRPELALARFTVEDAKAFIVALETEFQAPRSEPCHLARLSVSAVLIGAPCGLAGSAQRSDLERRVLTGYEELYGPSSLPLPSSLEDSRWFRALKLSPRYMDEGVRAAAMEMLSSPTVAYSMALSLMLYVTAWAVPEPLFSKALASAVTVGLLMTYSAAELYTVGQACLNLYREAEAARSQEELEAVARRFGKAIGCSATTTPPHQRQLHLPILSDGSRR
ncbi:hypothetical protein OV287_22195 [Archangium sp. miwbw1]|uniref:Uncharacterized protein n=1 Tax=Archangium lansingense TaxID=2995310 RepID=A0ABT4A6C5_9BACT|nr:hypothetical protein [Archangium lansinium]MCY1077190.1 hypothetical protein [Archangium lansinium]